MDLNNKYLIATEAAELLHVGKSTLYSYVKQGLITPIKVGRRFLFQPDEIHRQLSINAVGNLQQSEVIDKFKARMEIEKIKVSPELMIAVEILLEVITSRTTQHS